MSGRRLINRKVEDREDRPNMVSMLNETKGISFKHRLSLML